MIDLIKEYSSTKFITILFAIVFSIGFLYCCIYKDTASIATVGGIMATFAGVKVATKSSLDKVKAEHETE